MKTNVIEEKMIYTTHEVAKILHSSPNYIYELIEKGKLKAIKLKSFKIRKSAVEEFLKENEGNDLSDLENVKRCNNHAYLILIIFYLFSNDQITNHYFWFHTACRYLKKSNAPNSSWLIFINYSFYQIHW